MGAMQRRKGARVELELVHLHRKLGIGAEKVPLSGATHYQGSGHDIDVMAFGANAAPLCCEVKARKSGAGFATLEKWLADNDALFLKRNNADPIVVVPFRIWALLLDRCSKSA
jgi:Holliday junction resolvase